MSVRRVAVLGGGNGAWAAAAELSLTGHEVRLFEVPQFADRMRPIAEAGRIRAHGVIAGDAPVEVTFNIEDAVADVDAVLIVVPTVFHRTYAELLAPVLADGMHVVLMPGSLGSLEFSEDLRRAGRGVDITISEFSALPYATRISGPTDVTVFGRRAIVSAGVFPSDHRDRVAGVLSNLYPGIEILPNVLAAGLNNPNPTLHCLGVLLSTSRIEYSHGDFYYYEEGMTPAVCRAIEAIDAERVAIGAALGVEVMSLLDTYDRIGYGPKGDTFWSVIRGVATLNGIKGPEHIDSRYLTEDVPIGLVIYSQLGAAVGVPTPLMTSVIAIAGAVLGRDFVADGRTLERCGIAGLTRDQLIDYVGTGRRAVMGSHEGPV